MRFLNCSPTLIFLFLFNPIFAQVPSYVPTNGLVGWWPFNGNANDLSGNGNNGTVNGATLTTDRFGVANRAYSYNGSSSFINVLNSNSLQFNGEITISTWVNANFLPVGMTSSTSYILSKGADGGTPYSWCFSWDTRNIGCAIFDNSNLACGPFFNLESLNMWYNVVVTFNGSVAKLYINGELRNSTTCPFNIFSNVYDLKFGRRHISGLPYFFNGKIDDIGIWNRALSCQEIQALYTSGAPYNAPTVSQISGPGSVVIGSSISLTNATNGGVWTSSNPSIATVDSIGTVRGISAGNVNIFYTVGNGCESVSDTQNVSVQSYIPQNNFITGVDTICSGSTTTLTANFQSSGNQNLCAPLSGTLSNGLVGYWPFCGNANDISGNGNNGTVNGATLTTDRFGNVGSAYSFDGVNDFIRIIHKSTLNAFPITISAWCRFYDTLYHGGGIASKYPYPFANNGWSMHLNGSTLSGYYFNYLGGAQLNLDFYQSQSANILDSSWHQVTLICNQLNASLYLDRQIVLTTSYTGNGLQSNCTNNTDMFFGRLMDTTNAYYFKGKIDDIAIYNRALSPQEIQQLYTLNSTQYLWSNGSTNSNIQVAPTQTTSYTCTVTENGQSSVDTFTVTVLQPSTSTLTQSACSSFTLNGQTYNQSGTYTQVRTNAAGCDSTITLNLTIRQPSTSALTQSACSSFTLNGQTYNQSGTYTQVRTNAAGCDSTITLNLTIRQPSASTLTQSACSSFTLNGQTYNQSGTYTQVRTNAAGCDSIITLNLTIRQPSTSTLNESACSSFTLNGQTYNQSGTYTQVRTNAAGCDSTITLNLTIRQPSSSVQNVLACNNYSLNGQTYTQSGIYTQTLQNAAGCDSILTLNLTLGGPTQNAIRVRSCGSYTLNGQTYTQSGTYVQNLINQFGCDSTLTIRLQLLPLTNSTAIHTACGSYTYNGQTFTSSGVYNIRTVNPNGCTSITTLRLTINQPSANTINQTACDSFRINGQTFTASGTYRQVLVNSVGCDSILTINLTIKQSSRFSMVAKGCNSYTLNGQTYTRSGTYYQTLVNRAGCDSIITLNLSITYPLNSVITRTACSSYTYNGVTYTQSGVYVQNGSATRCTGTTTIYLTIHQPTSSTVRDTAIGSYAFNGQIYATSGTYTQRLVNSVGCDSIITLNLTILTPRQPMQIGEGQTAEGEMNVGQTSGLQELNPLLLKIYPNPTSSKVMVDFGQMMNNVALNLYSVDGRLLQTIQLNGRQTELDLSAYPPAVYLLELKTEYGVRVVEKLIKF